MKNNDTMTSYSLFTTLVATVIGIGVFSYPRDLTELVKSDGWLVTLIAGIVCILLVTLIWKAEKANGFKDFSVILKDNFGKSIGNIILIIFILFEIIMISMGMRIFVEVIKMFLLNKTPTEFLLICTILCGYYLIRGEVRSLIRFNEVSFWIMFLPIIVIFIMVTDVGDFTNIFPIFQAEGSNYIKALRTAIFSFGGLEIIYLLAPFVQNKSKGLKVAKKGVLFIVLFYTLITILVLSVFSIEQTKIQIWPTLTMIKSLNVAGSLIERWDGIVMALWVFFYFSTFSNIFYFSSRILKEVIRVEDVKISSIIIMPIIYIVAMYPKNIGEVFYYTSLTSPIYFIFTLIVLPLLMLLIGRSKGYKEVN